MTAFPLKRGLIRGVAAWQRSDPGIVPCLQQTLILAVLCFITALCFRAAGLFIICALLLLLTLPLLRHVLKLCQEAQYFRKMQRADLLPLYDLFCRCQPQGKQQKELKRALPPLDQLAQLRSPRFWESSGRPLLQGLQQAVYLGEGFEWDTVHLNAFELLYQRNEPSSFFAYPRGEVIHALGRDQLAPVLLPCSHLTSHALIFGTTGSGKSTLLSLLIIQALLRRECVIVLDPKSDSSLIQKVCDVATSIGREDDLHFLDLSGGANNVRLNPLSRFKRSSEIAERLTASMSGEGTSLTFKSYAQNAVSAAVSLLLLLQRPITLDAVRGITAQHQNFARGLLEYLDLEVQHLNREDATLYLNRIKKGYCPDTASAQVQAEPMTGVSPGTSRRNTRKRLLNLPKTEHLISFYQWLCNKNYVRRSEHFYAAADAAAMDPSFYAKVTAALKPRLNLLTNSDLKNLLSDGEKGLTLAQLIRRGGILYVALSCLSDSTLGSEVGKLVMADIRAIAGNVNAQNARPLHAKLNPGQNAFDPGLRAASGRINVFIDEASEVVDNSTVQLLNKGRGCGFALTLATQSFADLSARLGQSGAQQVAANCNTLISLRILDLDSAMAVSGSFPAAPAEDISYGINYQENGTGLGYGGMKSVDYHQISLVPPALLSALPDFHYVARLADGRIIKGKVPLITLPQATAPAQKAANAAVQAA